MNRLFLAAILVLLSSGAARAAVLNGTVTEFYNNDLDHYFITADPAEAAAIDRGSAGPGWSRTGETFYSGGSTPVCRFYGSVSPGPNSHFYTAAAAECEQLKQIQAVTPGNQKRWNFESLDFLTTVADSAGCPAGTVPVYRAYNNGFPRGVDSNHRITTNQAGIQQVVSRGWVNEGVVMCGPTEEGMAAITQFWQQAAGVWYGWPEVVFRLDASGGYLLGWARDATPGLERGRFAYDPLTRRFTVIVDQDTNGPLGLSNRSAAELLYTIGVEGGLLVTRNPGGGQEDVFGRVSNVQTSLVGMWAVGAADSLTAQHFVFFDDGRFMMIDPVGDDEASHCGPPGIEYGTYTWNGGTGTLTITGVTIDTNGCAGLNDRPPSGPIFAGPNSFNGLVLSPDGNTLTAGDIQLHRVSQ